MNTWFKIIGLSLGLLLSGCQSVSTTDTGAIGIERQQNMFTLLSAQQVETMAGKAYQQTLQKARKAQKLNQEPGTVQRLRTIADRLQAQVGVFRPDARRWPWEVNLITDKQLNAYCMPGGKIIFFSGIISQLKLNDAEIAAIMGHEMAHALREHGREAMSEAYALEFGKNALQMVLGLDDPSMALADTLVNYALTLPNSRTKEVEADLIGLELMARAGYDPRAAVSLWQKMARSNSSKVPEFMSTHPANDTRISGLQASVSKVEPLYQKALKNR